MRTGKGRSEGQAFHRRLLSEYNTEITLENYVAYFELKPIAKAVEETRKRIEKLQKAKQNNNKIGTSGMEIHEELTLAELREKRKKLEDEFFAQLHASYVKVKDYLLWLENDLKKRVYELKQLAEEEIRAQPEQHIPKLYIKVQSILQYRALNLAAFRKIMKKFLERCACDSLELQQRLLAVDDVIYRSALSQPRLDLRRIALDLIALFGTVFRLTYEDTVTHLSRYEHCAGVNVRRILPHSDTFFFTLNVPHQERQGDFAVRILPGNTSLFCEKMICEVLQCERYPPCCSQFPNGEINVALSKTIRGDDVFVLQSLVKCDHLGLSHSGALMELALMLHTARLSSAARITAVIPYLAYTGSVSSMAVVAELLETMGCQHVITVDMASEQVEGMFSVPLETISARYEFVRYIANHLTNEGHSFQNIAVVAPTGTSVHRARGFADALMRYKKLSREEQFVSVCTAVQRQLCVAPTVSVSPTSGANVNITSGGNIGGASSCGSSVCAQFNHTTDVEVAAQTRLTPVENITRSVTASSLEQQSSGIEMIHPNNNITNNTNTNTTCKVNTGVQEQLVRLMSPLSDASPFPCESCSTVAFERALRRQEEGVSAIRNITADTSMSTEAVALVGDVKDRLCIIVDTCIDEAIDICRTALKLREEGASRIILLATHFILSGAAVERLIRSPIDLIVVTDSVDQDEVFKNPRIAQKLRVLPIAPLLARAIEKMHTENSLATLFEK